MLCARITAKEIVVQKVLGFAMVLVSGSTLAGWFGPSNYAECVLKNIKGVSGDMAANAVRMACNRQFPIPNVLPAPNPLPDNPTAADIQAYVVQRNACIQADTERKYEWESRGGSYTPFNCGEKPPKN